MTDDNRLVNSDAVTPENEHDISATDKLLNCEEEKVYGDSGHASVGKREEYTENEVDWQLLEPLGKHKGMHRRRNFARTQQSINLR